MIGRSPHGWTPRLPVRDRSSRSATDSPPYSEDGFLLVEVIISAMLVGLVVVATFTGFDVVNRLTAAQRQHGQATVLAAQSQEQLRSDPASALTALIGSPHSYTQTIGGQWVGGKNVGGTTYTVTQEDKLVIDTEPNATCNAAAEKQSEKGGNYFRVTSKVTWPQLGNRPPVTQSSVITPPTGSGLEVDVTTPAVGVSGATVISNANGGAPLSTSVNGCVTYAGIPSTSATVEVYKLGYVTETGAFTVPSKVVSIVPNLTKHYSVVLNEGGAIKANFTNKGAAVTGDTFVAANSLMKVPPEFEVGATKTSINSEGSYEALTGTYEASATTPVSLAKYPTGDLFPLNGAWATYAGDCIANNPTTVTGGTVKSGSIAVKAGATVEVSVPTTNILVNVYEGTKAVQKSLETKPYAVKITNTACTASPIPNNASKANLEHIQQTKVGHLEDPFQPFGKAKLCLAYNPTAKPTTHRTYTVEYNSNSEAVREENIYVSEKTTPYESPGSKDKVAVAEGKSEC